MEKIANTKATMNTEATKNMEATRKNNSMVHVEVKDVNMASYQRPVNLNCVRKMASEYEPHRMRPIELSFRDGKLWCFDGQHRVAMFKRLGITRIPAQIHYGLSYQDEAALFAKQHEGERRVNAGDRWKAGCIAGDKMHEISEIKNILGEYGYSVEARYTPGSTKAFSCVATLMRGYKDFGEAGLRCIVNVLDSAWKGCANVTSADVVSGLFKLYGAYGESVDYGRLTKCLAKHTPTSFIRDSQEEIGRGGTRVARHMVRTYNKKLARNRLDVVKIKG